MNFHEPHYLTDIQILEHCTYPNECSRRQKYNDALARVIANV